MQDLKLLYLLVLSVSIKQLHNLSSQYHGMDYLLYGGQRQVDPHSFATGLAAHVDSASKLRKGTTMFSKPGWMETHIGLVK